MTGRLPECKAASKWTTTGCNPAVIGLSFAGSWGIRSESYLTACSCSGSGHDGADWRRRQIRRSLSGSSSGSRNSASSSCPSILTTERTDEGPKHARPCPTRGWRDRDPPVDNRDRAMSAHEWADHVHGFHRTPLEVWSGRLPDRRPPRGRDGDPSGRPRARLMARPGRWPDREGLRDRRRETERQERRSRCGPLVPAVVRHRPDEQAEVFRPRRLRRPLGGTE